MAHSIRAGTPHRPGHRRSRSRRLAARTPAESAGDRLFSVVPDWICEVTSPSTAALDRVKKLNVYAREQVSYAWLADPIGQTIEVLRLESGRWTIVTTCAGSDVVRLEPFDAIEMDLTLLWETPPV